MGNTATDINYATQLLEATNQGLLAINGMNKDLSPISGHTADFTSYANLGEQIIEALRSMNNDASFLRGDSEYVANIPDRLKEANFTPEYVVQVRQALRRGDSEHAQAFTALMAEYMPDTLQAAMKLEIDAAKSPSEKIAIAQFLDKELLAATRNTHTDCLSSPGVLGKTFPTPHLAGHVATVTPAEHIIDTVPTCGVTDKLEAAHRAFLESLSGDTTTKGAVQAMEATLVPVPVPNIRDSLQGTARSRR